MNRRKNGFFTFLCSLIPGAGEMHLGFMKEGTSIMLLSLLLLAGGSFLGISALFLLLPVIWFYSFFNVHNKAGMSDEEFYALEDDYLFHLDSLFPQGRLNGRQTTVFAWILIILGVSIIWGPAVSGLLHTIEMVIPDAFVSVIRSFLYHLPQYIVAVILIMTGIHMIHSKKKELDEEEKKEEKNFEG